MKDKLNNKNIIITVIVLLLILGIGFSYAWWRYTVIQDKTNVGVSKCFSIELANQANEINLTNMYPITDEEGRKLTPYTFTLKNTCSVSAKYSLNMEMLEGTTLNSNYLAVLVNNKDIKLLSSYNTATTVVKGSTESRTLDTGILAPNGSKDYSISIWMDKSVTLSDDAQNKVFKSKVVVDAVATESAMDKIIASVDTTGKCPTINSDGTVNVTKEEATDGYVCSATDTYGTSYYYRGNVTNNYVKFGKWPDDTPTVVYGYYSETSNSHREYDSMETCQNASSYNTNCTIINRAGKDMYWRIIRINGDGSVRVIYDGTSANTNGESSTDREIGVSAFNEYWKKDNVQEATNSYVYGDNAGVGYMYGNRDAIVEATEYYSSTNFANTNTYYIAKEYNYDATTDRFMLKDPIAVLGSAMTSDYVGYYTFDSTYIIHSSGYSSSYGLKKIFGVTAGDSSASVKYGYVMYGTSSKEVAQTNTNDSTIKTYLDNWYKTNISGTENEQYLADNIFCNDRSFSSSNSGTGAGVSKTYYNWYNWHASKSNLKCPQQNDAFTVSDTSKGNGVLTYPIGLITTDEAVLAGGWTSINNGYYLYSGSVYWAFSPKHFYGGNAYVICVNSNGYVVSSSFVHETDGVRPVLNLLPEVLNNGDGSMNDPYHP